MIKAVFFDIDGTLLSHTDMTVSVSTRDAIRQLQEKGIRCLIATGRHVSELDMLPVKDIKFDGYITLNGQVCYDSNKKCIYSDPISGEDKTRLLDIFNKKERAMLMVEETDMYLNMLDQEALRVHEMIESPIPDIGEYSGNDFYMAVVYGEKGTEEKLKEDLPNCKITRWHPYASDINSASGSKVTGIEKYLELAGISKEETMAFGDGENDLEMLNFVQIGVAMGNAVPEVKDSADFVTSTVDEDGIYNALEYFSLIGE